LELTFNASGDGGAPFPEINVHPRQSALLTDFDDPQCTEDQDDFVETPEKAELERDLKTLGASISGKKLDLQYRLVAAREAFYNRLAEDELL
jgi:hypothetical protein